MALDRQTDDVRLKEGMDAFNNETSRSQRMSEDSYSRMQKAYQYNKSDEDKHMQEVKKDKEKRIQEEESAHLKIKSSHDKSTEERTSPTSSDGDVSNHEFDKRPRHIEDKQKANASVNEAQTAVEKFTNLKKEAEETGLENMTMEQLTILQAGARGINHYDSTEVKPLLKADPDYFQKVSSAIKKTRQETLAKKETEEANLHNDEDTNENIIQTFFGAALTVVGLGLAGFAALAAASVIAVTIAPVTAAIAILSGIALVGLGIVYIVEGASDNKNHDRHECDGSSGFRPVDVESSPSPVHNTALQYDRDTRKSPPVTNTNGLGHSKTN